MFKSMFMCKNSINILAPKFQVIWIMWKIDHHHPSSINHWKFLNSFLKLYFSVVNGGGEQSLFLTIQMTWNIMVHGFMQFEHRVSEPLGTKGLPLYDLHSPSPVKMELLENISAKKITLNHAGNGKTNSSQLAHYLFCVQYKKSKWLSCTVGQNSQESGRKYWATHSSIRSFARTAHSFACSGLLASLAPSAALTRSLARSLRSLPRSWESEFLMSQNDLVLSHSELAYVRD